MGWFLDHVRDSSAFEKRWNEVLALREKRDLHEIKMREHDAMCEAQIQKLYDQIRELELICPTHIYDIETSKVVCDIFIHVIDAVRASLIMPVECVRLGKGRMLVNVYALRRIWSSDPPSESKITDALSPIVLGMKNSGRRKMRMLDMNKLCNFGRRIGRISEDEYREIKIAVATTKAASAL